MKMFVEVGCQNGEKLLHFYVNELKLFYLSGEYGMGCFKIVDRDKKFGLIIRESNLFKARENILFTIEVACVEDFISRFNVLNLKSQGAHIASEIFEWPGGKSVPVIDVAGNKFLVSEEHLFSS